MMKLRSISMSVIKDKFNIVADVFNDCEVCTECQYFMHPYRTPYGEYTCDILDGFVPDPEFCPGYEQYKNELEDEKLCL
tara:strand:+ start:432 stop:668 length:237 start_codon:yes stop_codon:yes gene_type:complete